MLVLSWLVKGNFDLDGASAESGEGAAADARLAGAPLPHHSEREGRVHLKGHLRHLVSHPHRTEAVLQVDRIVGIEAPRVFL